MNTEQIKQAFLGLLGGSGPLAALLVQVFGYPSEKVTVTLNAIAAITPFIWLGIQLMRTTIRGQVQQVASLPPADMRAALASMPAATQVQIATATISDADKIKMVTALPDITHVVAATTATDGVAAAVADPNQPKVVGQ